MPRPLLLSVNIDHVATLRQARGAPYPDPVVAAAIAEDAGAEGITVHLRGDRRHIQDDDVRRLRPRVRGKLNLEMAASEEMLRLAAELKPDQVTLVPERPEEVTTEGGLDLLSGRDHVLRAVERLRADGIESSLFLDPDPVQLEVLAELGTELVPGFEINTDAYTQADGVRAPVERAAEELEKVRRAAVAGAGNGFRVYAGHGLTTANVIEIAALAEIGELNIGHWLISRAALVGLAAAVEEMLAAMREGRSRLG
ncbi:MAG: pyridoxine 5'-phosphate synthase [Thermoanaerobaculia bacterium]